MWESYVPNSVKIGP